MSELKFEEGKMNLTEDQEAQIAIEARNEILGIKKPEEKKDDAPKSNENKADDKGGADNKEDNPSVDDVKKVPSEDEQNIKEVEEEKKGETNDSAKDEVTKKREALIKDYATKENITLEQATEEVAKNEAVIKKYGDDPIKLAAALRKAQSDFDKTRSEFDRARQQAQQPKLDDFASVRSHVDKKISENKEKLIEMYRAEYPGLSANLEDDAIVDLMRKEATEKMMVRVEESRLNQSRIANDKRNKLLNSFSDDDKSFLSEVKTVLDNTPDNVLLDEKYTVEDILRWARGDKQRIEKLVKDAEERGYKRGKEEPKIIGEKLPNVPTSKSTPTDSKVVYSSKLTESQRQSALNKFEGQKMSDEEKYRFFYETYVKKG